MWELIGIVLVTLIAYAVALVIVGFVTSLFLDNDVANSPQVAAAIVLAAVFLLALMAFLYRSRGSS